MECLTEKGLNYLQIAGMENQMSGIEIMELK